MTRTPTVLERRLTRYRHTGTITQREFHILVLRFEHQLTLSQIALALDVSRGTVTSTLRRARQKIEIHEREAA